MASFRINKTRSCRIVYILQTMTPDSPLDRSIHKELGNIQDDIDGISPLPTSYEAPRIDKSKVSSCRIIYILETITSYSPLDRFVNLELGDIVHEGQYQRHSSLCRGHRIHVLVLPKSTKQGEYCQLVCILQSITIYLSLDRFSTGGSLHGKPM
jgi:hypothetical protein